MIIVYGGSQADEPGRAIPRLPASAEGELMDRLRGLIQSLKPSLLVGALAAGADILFARAALLENIPVRILLPFSRAEFLRTSVQSSGDRWINFYDAILNSDRVTVIEGSAVVEESASTFADHNSVMLDDATALAKVVGERVWVIAVRPEPKLEAPSVTDELVNRAEERNHLTIDLSPMRSGKTAFVVMPYGRKRDSRSGRHVDCDPPFHQIYRPLLEDVDVCWNRADLQTDSGIIHTGMLADLANSDLVLVDLSTTNFNVAYELGVRHVFAAHATVLVNPRVESIVWQAPPFDVNIIRIHSFTRSLILSDLEAEAAILSLRPVLNEALTQRKIDSPAHNWFDLDYFVRPFAQRTALPAIIQEEIDARTRVAVAIRSSDAGAMREAEVWLDATNSISDRVKRALRIELAAGLLDESEIRDARRLLDLAQPALSDPLHRLWLQKSVMAYRRLGETTTENDQRRNLLERARSLLSEAELAGYADSETYGTWGGLIKRQIEYQTSNTDPTVVKSLFKEMAGMYQKGFELDPSYYTGVNIVMALRLSGRTRDEAFREEFNEALTVSKFLTRRALESDPEDYWAHATKAELLLHDCLENNRPTEPVVELYADAGRRAHPGQLVSSTFQLRFLKSRGYPGELIDRLLSVLAPAR